jgi:hypothetical protein
VIRGPCSFTVLGSPAAAVASGLTSVSVSVPTTYANGDQVQFLDLTFRRRAVGGDARVNDAESVEVGWFHRTPTQVCRTTAGRC